MLGGRISVIKSDPRHDSPFRCFGDEVKELEKTQDEYKKIKGLPGDVGVSGILEATMCDM